MTRRLFTAAIIAGTLAGLLLTAVQYLQVIPIILEAETYEVAEVKTYVASEIEKDIATEKASHAIHDHHDNALNTGHMSHEHNAANATWSPASGVERCAFTALSNVLAGIGFALVLASGMAIRGKNNWRNGLLWGLGGYAVFFVAPSLGLPPELPGTLSADLLNRQLWWIATVISTGAGIALMMFANSILSKGVGAILIVTPHVVGAPLPQIHSSLAPASLVDAFIQATAIANGIFWLTLGSLNGFFLRKGFGNY